MHLGEEGAIVIIETLVIGHRIPSARNPCTLHVDDNHCYISGYELNMKVVDKFPLEWGFWQQVCWRCQRKSSTSLIVSPLGCTRVRHTLVAGHGFVHLLVVSCNTCVSSPCIFPSYLYPHTKVIVHLSRGGDHCYPFGSFITLGACYLDVMVWLASWQYVLRIQCDCFIHIYASC